MKYLNEKNILEIGVDWEKLTDSIEDAVVCLSEGKSSQPIKPYLRFKDPKNRIIAMPAYLGNEFDIAGIKWIASFPDNIHKQKPRAHSVTILNSSDTGEPLSIINTSLVSVLRTVAVSRLMVKYYAKAREIENPKIGIIGFGPIGRYHLDMTYDFFKDSNAQFYIYDIKDIDPELLKTYKNVTVVNSWAEAYDEADVFMTCTVSNDRYIDRKPKENSLHLNVSLRDYQPETLKYFGNGIIVDKWEEICRENTDIEVMHNKYGLQQEEVKTIEDIVVKDRFKEIEKESPVIFNPMGMSVFDMAVANHFYEESVEKNIGSDL